MYNDVVCVTYQFSSLSNGRWLTRKLHVAILDTVDSLVADICKTSMMPNIRDDAITAMIQLTEGSLNYASRIQQFSKFYEGLDSLLYMNPSAFAS
jgi:hypothetical protein